MVLPINLISLDIHRTKGPSKDVKIHKHLSFISETYDQNVLLEKFL